MTGNELGEPNQSAPAIGIESDFAWLATRKDAFGALGNIGSVAGLFFVALGVWLTWRTLRQQIKANAAERIEKRQSYARQKFEEYLDKALDHPEYMLQFWKTEQGIFARERYRWFVKHVLWASEEVIKGFPDDPDWTNVVIEHVKYHAAYLASDSFREGLTFEKPVRDIIDRVVAEAQAAESTKIPSPSNGGP